MEGGFWIRRKCNGNETQTGNNQRPSGIEAEHFGSWGPQTTVALEKDELEEDEKNLLLKFLQSIIMGK
jgi:hypothetical protein